ncbi:unnamed protein product [Thelazia callipaeda]|uniref:PAM2 domain-containing protein n=1 Tax=Thelazia callipaeda TaxID=103827 RepID=A0A0N5CJW8_THECL|nr:unnamed protein product [Thelazia callipaeda]
MNNRNENMNIQNQNQQSRRRRKRHRRPRRFTVCNSSRQQNKTGSSNHGHSHFQTERHFDLKRTLSLNDLTARINGTSLLSESNQLDQSKNQSENFTSSLKRCSSANALLISNDDDKPLTTLKQLDKLSIVGANQKTRRNLSIYKNTNLNEANKSSNNTNDQNMSNDLNQTSQSKPKTNINDSFSPLNDPSVIACGPIVNPESLRDNVPTIDNQNHVRDANLPSSMNLHHHSDVAPDAKNGLEVPVARASILTNAKSPILTHNASYFGQQVPPNSLWLTPSPNQIPRMPSNLPYSLNATQAPFPGIPYPPPNVLMHPSPPNNYLPPNTQSHTLSNDFRFSLLNNCPPPNSNYRICLPPPNIYYLRNRLPVHISYLPPTYNGFPQLPNTQWPSTNNRIPLRPNVNCPPGILNNSTNIPPTLNQRASMPMNSITNCITANLNKSVDINQQNSAMIVSPLHGLNTPTRNLAPTSQRQRQR